MDWKPSATQAADLLLKSQQKRSEQKPASEPSETLRRAIEKYLAQKPNEPVQSLLNQLEEGSSSVRAALITAFAELAERDDDFGAVLKQDARAPKARTKAPYYNYCKECGVFLGYMTYEDWARSGKRCGDCMTDRFER